MPKKTPAKTAVVKQPHGGALIKGGQYGNAGGDGRPPSLVRQACRKAFDERIPILVEIADEKANDLSERIKAIDTLGKYGIGPPRGVDVDDVKQRVADSWALFRPHIPDKILVTLMEPYRQIWSR